MSEQGWRDFLAAEGVGDWVVLHGGATAVFRVLSLSDAARLADAIAQVPGIEGAGVLVTIADDQVTVRLTRGIWQLEPRHAELARAVSTVARRHGAVADRARVQEVGLAIAAHPETVDVGFWRAVLGYARLADDNAVDPLGHGSTVWMQDLDDAKPLRHAMHIDVSVAREHVQARLAAALAAGGRIVRHWDNPQAWTLADRAGNRVCICAWPDGAAGSAGLTQTVVAQDAEPAGVPWPAHLPVGALRVVRWSPRYEQTVIFYRDILGLPVLETFQDSYGLDGTILGLPGGPVHLEIVRSPDAQSRPAGLDQLVFYLPDLAARDQIMARLAGAGVDPVEQIEYWQDNGGVTYRDPDGREVVFASWVYRPPA